MIPPHLLRPAWQLRSLPSFPIYGSPQDTQKRKREEGDVPDLVSDESEEVEESEGDEDGEEDEEDEESESPRKRGANRKPVARPSKRARVEKEEKPERKGRASKDASDPSTLPVTKMDLGPIPEDPTAPISWNVFLYALSSSMPFFYPTLLSARTALSAP